MKFVKNNLPIFTILKGLNTNNRRCNLRSNVKRVPKSEGLECLYKLLDLYI